MAETEKPAPDGWEVDEFVRKLRDFEQAYSTEFFVPLTEAEKNEMGGFLLSRVSAEMGRHLAKFLTQAAARIEQASSLLAEKDEQIRALMNERTSLIETKREQIERLELSRGAASKVALDAIAEKEAAEARLREAEEEIARCHARFEIDHVYVLGETPDRDFVRQEVPMNERQNIPDAVACRDARITLLEADLKGSSNSREKGE